MCGSNLYVPQDACVDCGFVEEAGESSTFGAINITSGKLDWRLAAIRQRAEALHRQWPASQEPSRKRIQGVIALAAARGSQAESSLVRIRDEAQFLRAALWRKPRWEYGVRKVDEIINLATAR
jgi:hypothetical protein